MKLIVAIASTAVFYNHFEVNMLKAYVELDQY